MIIKKENKNLIQQITLSIVLIYFCFNTYTANAAQINFSPATGEYKVGDIIEVKTIVSSDIPMNAVSAGVSYPINNLSLISISQNSSIIKLWTKEPVYSNEEGTAYFEGITLKGFTGNSGSVVTLLFRAKSKGQAEIKFFNASILADNGKGTELIKGNNSAIFTIDKSTTNESVESISGVESIINKCKDVVTEVKQIEEDNKMPDYSLIILLAVTILLLLVLFLIYVIHYINKLKKYLRKKLPATENDISDKFKVLEEDINKEIVLSEKLEGNEGLIKEEKELLTNFKNDIENTEEAILGDIKDIEKNSD